MNYKLIRQDAKARLKGNWTTSVMVVLIYFLLSLAIEGLSTCLPYGLGLAMSILAIVIAGPLAYGIRSIFLNLNRGKKPVIEDMFCGFSSKSRASIITAGISIYVYTFLWSLLLIVPGIIANYSYSMTYYILLDNPYMSANDAIAKSKEMMNGRKKDLFFLDLTFIGWILLGIISCGIGFLWICPYMETARARFYEAIANKGRDGEEDTQTIVKNENEVNPFGGSDAQEVKTYKCYNCGAEEKSTETVSICKYCGGDMGEDK